MLKRPTMEETLKCISGLFLATPCSITVMEMDLHNFEQSSARKQFSKSGQ